MTAQLCVKLSPIFEVHSISCIVCKY